MKRGNHALSSQFRHLALRLCAEKSIVFTESPSNTVLLEHVRALTGMAAKGGKRATMARAIPAIAAAQSGQPVANYAAVKLALSGNFYSSDEWRQTRYHALLANDGRCECCGASKASGAVLHVDHIKPRSRFPEFALDLANLQVLCADCNIGKGAADETDWRRDADVIVARKRPSTEQVAAA